MEHLRAGILMPAFQTTCLHCGLPRDGAGIVCGCQGPDQRRPGADTAFVSFAGSLRAGMA